MSNKWKLNKAGMFNYWYYDEAEFKFADGRLLLRGSNGSGKSVTMQSLITVLLDGVTHAKRLDSFGSQARRIEDYLLGEKDVSNCDDRIGYLYFEYKRADTEQYFTSGIGLHARRGVTSKVDFWGFCIEDGRRIGKDIVLYKLLSGEKGNRVKSPLNKKELINVIGNSGRITTDRKEYQSWVNKYIFNFPSLEKYDELINLLIQLRSPKLSKDFKPSVIYEILNASLPALSEEDMRPLAETLDNIQKARNSIEQMKKERESFIKICNAYTRANKEALVSKYLEYEHYDKLVKEMEKSIAAAEQELSYNKQLEEASIKQQNEFKLSEVALRAEQDELKQNEAYKAAAEKKELLDSILNQRKSYEDKDKALTKKRHKELDLEKRISEAEVNLAKLEEKSADILCDMNELAYNADFIEHDHLGSGFKIANSENGLYFNIWDKLIYSYQDKLRHMMEHLKKYDKEKDEYNRLERNLSDEHHHLDDLIKEEQSTSEKLEFAKESLVKLFYEWKEAYATIIPISQGTAIEMSSAMRDLYNSSSWQEITKLLEDICSLPEQNLFNKLTKQQANKNIKDADIRALQEKLQELENKQEVEPEISEGVKISRQKIADSGIKFIPFYDAVDFKDSILPEIRERLEGALIAANVLNSIILENNELADVLPDYMVDNIVFSRKAVDGASLADYLVPVNNGKISLQRIDEILRSIAVDNSFLSMAANDSSGLTINVEKAAYRQGNISGNMEARSNAIYIGKHAREQFRIQQMEECKSKIAEAEEIRIEIINNISQIEAEMKKLENAKRQFPDNKVIEGFYHDLNNIRSVLENQKKRVESLYLQKMASLDKLKSMKEAMAEKHKSTVLRLNLDDYTNALQYTNDYIKSLSEMKFIEQGYRHCAGNYKEMRSQLEELNGEVDELRGELGSLELSIKKNEMRMEVLDNLLQGLNAAAIEERILYINGELAVLPEKLQAAARCEASAHSKIEQLEKDIAGSDRKLELNRILAAEWKRIFEIEESYNYVVQNREIKPLLRELISRRKENESTFEDLIANTMNIAYKELDILSDYQIGTNVEEISLASIPQLSDDEYDTFYDKFQKLRNSSRRTHIISVLEGKKVNIYEQKEYLKQQIEQQSNILTEKDKSVYKEIIINNIGRKISEKIFAAEAWIKKMNRLMADSDASSGLKLRLEWKPERTEGNVNTNELVQILHSDPAAMKDSDMEKVSQYFSERIEKARNDAEASDRGQDAFQENIREMLDYRLWYRFKLEYEKGAVTMRELTDKAFCKLSGGEKAMAMYVPLFSAVYSKYQEADKEAPYIISLDEAFAGVDGNNIRDMFKLVERLGFNYIMNSQVIRGEHDVVPALNTYELLRPQNANYVTVIPFHWNGRILKMMDDDDNEWFTSE